MNKDILERFYLFISYNYSLLIPLLYYYSLEHQKYSVVNQILSNNPSFKQELIARHATSFRTRFQNHFYHLLYPNEALIKIDSTLIQNSFIITPEETSESFGKFKVLSS